MESFLKQIKLIVLSEKNLLVILLALSIFTRFFIFGFPNQIVFDEFYFGNFVSRYFDGAYFFDIHPPLAKLIMAGTAEILNNKPDTSFSFNSIGQYYSNDAYKIFRGVVGVFGVLLVLVIYGFARELFKNKWIGFLAGLLVVFDSALNVHARFIFLDSILLFFGFGSLWLLLISFRKNGWVRWLLFVLSGIFVACSLSTKWTGLLFVGLFGILLISDIFKNKKWKEFLLRILICGLIIPIVYFSLQIVHLSLLTKNGNGAAFMSPEFQSTLQNSPYDKELYEEPSIWQKLKELNQKMWYYNETITKPHPDQSEWYQWPFGVKQIYFWVGTTEADYIPKPKLYLRANQFVWYGGLVAIIFGIIWFIIKSFYKNKSEDFWAIGLLLLGYLANLAPYVFISRPAFLYHYFPSLIFAIVGFSWLMLKFFRKYPIIIILLFMMVIWYWIGNINVIYGI